MPANRRRRVASALAPVAVLVVVVLVWWVSRSGQQVPPGTEGVFTTPTSAPGSEEPGDEAPATPPRLSNENGVPIDGYLVEDRTRLALNYTAGVPECAGRLGPPEVLETDISVTVTLTLVPPATRPEQCTELAELHTVRLDLGSPLGGRPVLDGSFAGRVEVVTASAPYE